MFPLFYLTPVPSLALSRFRCVLYTFKSSLRTFLHSSNTLTQAATKSGFYKGIWLSHLFLPSLPLFPFLFFFSPLSRLSHFILFSSRPLSSCSRFISWCQRSLRLSYLALELIIVSLFLIYVCLICFFFFHFSAFSFFHLYINACIFLYQKNLLPLSFFSSSCTSS